MDNFIILLLTFLGVIALSLSAGWYFGLVAGLRKAEKYFRKLNEGEGKVWVK